MTRPGTPPDHPYWQEKSLADLSPEEWEALCDGCGKCCLWRLEDEASGDITYTNIACRLLDPRTGRCRDYARRHQEVAECFVITPEFNRDHPNTLPETCAYRRLAEGRELPPWHPLRSGDPQSVRRAGHAVAGRVVNEGQAGPLGHHLVDWFD
jgi:uncharacterized protein